MEPLSLTLLGRFQAQLGSQPVPSFRTKATQALLIYLTAQPNEAHNRERLMTLLWPGMPQKSARANLRQTLYQLRQDIPDVKAKVSTAVTELVTANRQEIRLNPAADVHTDAIRFDSLLSHVANHQHLDLMVCPDCRADLESAIALYQDHFLVDFYLEDSNEFEDWAQARREHYRRRALDTLETLTTVAVRQEAYAAGQAYAERQLAIDNLRESAYRQLMELLSYAGRREEALAVYDRCRRTLMEELSMEPSTRTSELYANIMAGDLTPQPAVAQGVRGLELREEIGQGAYGIIFRAFQPSISRDVAVKVIRRKYANDPEFIRRFEAEAQNVARLEHPYIIPLYDYWRDPNGAYLVMRYVKKGSLETALKTGSWDPKRVLRLVDQIGSALDAAHLQGVIHRDIKPGNILLDDSGNAYLTDFGIAKVLASTAAGEGRLTNEGSIVGTLDYISPEQIQDQPVSPQTDIYSFGAVLYETLTGEKPFGESSVANLLHSHLNQPIPQVSASRPDLPSTIDDVLQKATAKRPSDRYETIQDMTAALHRALAGQVPNMISTEALPMPAVADPYNPYKGLRAFQEADADDFFGRDALIERLVSRLTLAGNRFLALVGPSGSGKSSAVKAGLIPTLRNGAIPGSEKWFVAEMVPGPHPLEELEQALRPLAVDPPPNLVQPMQRDLRGLLRTVRRVLPDEDVNGPQLLLVIDQFEELFTLVANPERRAFFLDSLVTALTAPRSPLRLVITLRADFYDRPLEQPHWGQLLKDNTEIILPLNQAELIWTVREPARRVGVILEEGLAETIVANVADQPGGLPLLQYALTELYDLREENRMTWNAYEEIGGVMGALGRRAEERFQKLDEAGKSAARQFFLRLVTLGGSNGDGPAVSDTRRRVIRSELEAMFLASPEAVHSSLQLLEPTQTLDAIIDAYGRVRLLTFDRDPLTREPTVEVAHEALLREWPRLRSWLDESRSDIRMQRQLAQSASEWQQANQDKSYLLRGARLEQFAGWAELSTVALTRDEQIYLDAALAARDQRLAAEEARRQKELETARQLAKTEKARADEQAQAASRLRKRAVLLGGALVIAAVLALATFFFAQESNRNATNAQQNAEAAATNEAEAINNLDLATTREAEAVAAEMTALNAQATAQTEANFRATAEVIAINEQALAEEQANLARSREFASAALLTLDDDPERSILLALQALSQSYTVEAESALRQALDTSRIRQSFRPPEGFPSGFVTASPDGRHLFVSGPGGATIWDITTGNLLFTHSIKDFTKYPEGYITEEWVNRADFSPDGSLLAIPNELWAGDTPLPGTITFLDATTFAELFTFPSHDGLVQIVTFNQDGTQFASAGLDGVIKIWDTQTTLASGTGQEVAVLCCHEEFIWSVAFSPDGTRLVSTSTDESVIIWDVQSREKTVVLEANTRDVVFSPDGRYILFGNRDGNVLVYEAASGDLHFQTASGHSLRIEQLAFSPDGTRLATSSQDRKAFIWDYAAGQLEPAPLVLTGHKSQVSGIAYLGDGGHVATGVFTSTEDSVRIWDISPRNGTEFGLNSHGDTIWAIDYSPDDRQFATASFDGTAVVWDVLTEQPLFTLAGHTGWVMDVAYSPDGTLLATASVDGTAVIWDANSGAPLFTLVGHEEGNVGNIFDGVLEAAFSPDGSRLATAGADMTARIWDVATGQELQILAGHTGGLTSVVYSPDGTYLATGSDGPDDGSIRIWDAISGQALFSLRPSHGDRPWALAFSPDGQLLVSAGQDTTAKVWLLDMASNSGRLLATLIGHDSTIIEVVLTPDGRLLATSGGDEVRLWDMTMLDSPSTLNGQSQVAIPELISLAGGDGIGISSDGVTLIAGARDGSFRVYSLDLQELLALARSRLTRTFTVDECRQYRLEPCPIGP